MTQAHAQPWFAYLDASRALLRLLTEDTHFYLGPVLFFGFYLLPFGVKQMLATAFCVLVCYVEIFNSAQAAHDVRWGGGGGALSIRASPTRVPQVVKGPSRH